MHDGRLPLLDEFVAEGHKWFRTPRLLLLPLKPSFARELLGSLLTDQTLASVVPWMTGKSLDDALREAFRIELECAAGQSGVWAVVEQREQVLLGAVLASASLSGTDLEVLLAPPFWNQGFADEATAPVLEWLADEGPLGFGIQ